MFLPLYRRNTHLVLELLAELQGDGKEHQCIVEPRHHTLHLVDVAHLKAIVVELAVKETEEEINMGITLYSDIIFLYHIFMNAGIVHLV